MKTTTSTSAAIAVLAVSVTASGTVQTTQCLLPSIPLDKFGTQFVFECQGYPTGVIVNSNADIHYFNDPGDDASGLMISIQAPSEGQPVWQFLGDDFGWSGDGVFTLDIDSDVLDGLIDLGTPMPANSVFVITIQMLGGVPLEGGSSLPCSPWTSSARRARGISTWIQTSASPTSSICSPNGAPTRSARRTSTATVSWTSMISSNCWRTGDRVREEK